MTRPENHSRTCSGNQQLQQAALDAAAGGATVLTATGRLSRHLLHRYRLARPAGAWPRPDICALNAWMRRAWQDLWAEAALAPTLTRLRLWQRAAAACPPPSPLEAGLPLLSQLDDAYEALVRHCLEPGRVSMGAPPLAEWRAEACAAFDRLMAEAGLLHPAHLAARLTAALDAGRLEAPAAVALAALDDPAPAEQALFAALGRRCRLTRLAPGPAAHPRLVSLPRARHEAEWVALEAARAAAAGVPPHAVGIVVPSMDDYGPELERALGELLGERLGEGWSAWNIAAPKPLSEAPLVRAALLPLRFLAEDEPRELLLALLTSPYYGRWRAVRHRVARADRAWRKLSVERGLRRLLAASKKEGVLQLIESGSNVNGGPPRLSELLEGLQGKATLRVWLQRLRSLWRALDFPHLERGEGLTADADANARKHLADALERLGLALGGEVFGLRELVAWLGHALSGELIDVPGREHAGLQALGLIEASGLAFEHLFVLGLHERGLPRPTRALPLLSTDERRGVRGGTWASQLAYGRATLGNLLAAGAEVTLSRPRLGESDEPLLPSPLWPEGLVEKGLVEKGLAEERLYEGEIVPFWPGSPWIEAVEAARAAVQASDPWPPEDFASGLTLPDSIRATALEGLLNCPFAFLAAEMLGIEPLEEPRAGIPPAERGSRLHRALACFTRRLREAGVVDGGAGVDARVLLEECVAQALADVAGDAFWELERRRWLGAGGEGGLLAAWLAAEGGAPGACVAEECSFEGLREAGWPFGVRGKIDRLDADEAGLFCWDYKTGSRLNKARAPLTEHPQLAAYGLAVRAGLLGKAASNQALCGLGYVHLASEAKVALKRLDPPEGLPAALAAFRAEVARRAQALAAGDFAPSWQDCLEDKARGWRRCPYAALCGLLGRLGVGQENGLESGEDEV